MWKIQGDTVGSRDVENLSRTEPFPRYPEGYDSNLDLCWHYASFWNINLESDRQFIISKKNIISNTKNYFILCFLKNFHISFL